MNGNGILKNSMPQFNNTGVIGLTGRVHKKLAEWISSSHRLTFVSVKDNIVRFKIENDDLYITCPKNKSEILFVECPDSNDFNSYIADYEPSFGRLLRKIEKSYKKIVISELIDIDIEEIQFRKKLLHGFKNMTSRITTFVKSTGIFSREIAGKILINEYLDVSKKFKDSNNINIKLLDGNVYVWKVFMSGFADKHLDELKDKYGYDYIEFEISFHDTMFPTYPPFIKAVRPRLNDIMHELSNLQMTQFDYWTPGRSMEYVINNLYSIVNKHAVINLDSKVNDREQFPDGAYLPLENVLLKLATFCEEVPEEQSELDDHKYEKIGKGNAVNVNKTTTKTRKKTGGSAMNDTGIGYAFSGKDWKPDEYVQLQNEKDQQLQQIIQQITTDIISTPDENINELYTTIKSSLIMKLVYSYLNGTTFLNMSNHADMYMALFKMLHQLANENAIFLFEEKIIDIMKELREEVSDYMKLSEEEDPDDHSNICNSIITLSEMVVPMYEKYSENVKKHKEEKKKIKVFEETDENTKYINCLKPECYEMVEFSGTQKFKYETKGVLPKKSIRRLGSEIASFRKVLPMHKSSSIFVRVNELDIRKMRVAITGPEGTAYDSGIFVFDLYVPSDYPSTSPLMNIVNQGGFRFNPNLYDNGKVCLSLLGTWPPNQWHKETSTLQQVFVSIQGQILVDTPYYNEPHVEAHYGTKRGDDLNKTYNNHIQYFNMKYTMCEMLKHPQNYPEFESVVKKHFLSKRKHILETCKKWVDNSFDSNSSGQHRVAITKQMFEDQYKELEELLNNLGPTEEQLEQIKVIENSLSEIEKRVDLIEANL